MKKRLTLKIYGSVQGVSYRNYAEEEGRRQKLTGYVKNDHDSSVIVVAEGEEQNLKDFLVWCREGSPAARVTKIEEKWGEAKGELEEFGMRY